MSISIDEKLAVMSVVIDTQSLEVVPRTDEWARLMVEMYVPEHLHVTIQEATWVGPNDIKATIIPPIPIDYINIQLEIK